MAGTLLHITIADAALERHGARHRRMEAALEHRRNYRLGAVFVDLPYFDRLWLNGLKTVFHRPLSFNEWGTAIHRKSPFSLLVELLDGASSPEEEAFALGAMTHHAVDLAFHPRIVREVREETDDDNLYDSTHKRIEDAYDVESHYHLLGHSGIGRPYTGRAMAIPVRQRWTRLATRAVSAIHGGSPTAARWGRWLNNLRMFALASVTPLPPWVHSSRQGPGPIRDAAISLTKRSLDECGAYLLAGCRYLEGEIGPDRLAEIIPDLSLLDGEAAIRARL